MFIYFYTQNSVFVLTNPRAENEERFFSRLRKSSRDVATNLDFEDLECPFKWNLMFCLCLWIPKYQTCWCGKTSLPVLHASQWGKWPFLVHLLVTLPQQFWSKLTFAFAGNKKMTAWDKYLLWFFPPTGCMEGIIPPWFHTVSLGVSLLLIYPKSIWLFMCGCWEMINSVVTDRKSVV